MDVEDEVSCTVCSEMYDNARKKPKCLPCSHALCLTCAEAIIRQSGFGRTLTCPECRARHTVPRTGASGLPNHVIITRLMTGREDKAKQRKRQDELKSHVKRLEDITKSWQVYAKTGMAHRQECLQRDADGATKDVEKRFAALRNHLSAREQVIAGQISKKVGKGHREYHLSLIDSELQGHLQDGCRAVDEALQRRKNNLLREILRLKDEELAATEKGLKENSQNASEVLALLNKFTTQQRISDEDYTIFKKKLGEMNLAPPSTTEQPRRLVVDYAEQPNHRIENYGRVWLK